MQTQEGTKDTLRELAQLNAEAKGQVRKGGSAEDELPEGTAPLEAKSEAEVSEEMAKEEAAVSEAPAQPEPDVEEEIRIGDKTFKSQREAIKYAEQLAHDNLVNEAYTQGIRDAAKVVQSPVVEQPKPEDDNFEERFYSDPKGTLAEVKKKAAEEALATIKAEQRRESLWSQFFEKNPDLSGNREICEQVLAKNWDTLGQMTDIDKAMSILATKTRSIFQDYIDRSKPRTELPNRGGQVVSTGGAAPKGVTPQKKEDAPLDFVSQMKRMKSRA